jgi:hypothetical protein
MGRSTLVLGQMKPGICMVITGVATAEDDLED